VGWPEANTTPELRIVSTVVKIQSVESWLPGGAPKIRIVNVRSATALTIPALKLVNDGG